MSTLHLPPGKDPYEIVKGVCNEMTGLPLVDVLGAHCAAISAHIVSDLQPKDHGEKTAFVCRMIERMVVAHRPKVD